ncbi:hypothetical protein SEA_PSONYX_32 [Corynebacterium phage PSonyx]|nr:hypothetical protein SEA_PSONYX_32 [Corynebacterium phage PSonyx]
MNNTAHTKNTTDNNNPPQLANDYTHEELAAIIESRTNYHDQIHKYDRELLKAAAHTIRQQARTITNLENKNNEQ